MISSLYRSSKIKFIYSTRPLRHAVASICKLVAPLHSLLNWFALHQYKLGVATLRSKQTMLGITLCWLPYNMLKFFTETPVKLMIIKSISSGLPNIYQEEGRCHFINLNDSCKLAGFICRQSFKSCLKITCMDLETHWACHCFYRWDDHFCGFPGDKTSLSLYEILLPVK